MRKGKKVGASRVATMQIAQEHWLGEIEFSGMTWWLAKKGAIIPERLLAIGNLWASPASEPISARLTVLSETYLRLTSIRRRIWAIGVSINLAII